MDALIFQGSEVKALGNGKVGGFLVLYSTANDPDLARDFFTPETDFGGAAKSAVYYDHGLDPTIGKRTLGEGSLEYKDAGVWIEAQLNLRDDYEKAVYELAKKGKLGWSSGTAPHLVEREQTGKSAHLKKWPLGLDASLTPTPCEPRTSAMPLKSADEDLLALINDLSAKSAHGLTLAEHSERTLGAVEEFATRLESYRDTKAADERPLSQAARDAIKAVRDRLDAILAYRSPAETLTALKTDQMLLDAEITQSLYGNPQ